MQIETGGRKSWKPQTSNRIVFQQAHRHRPALVDRAGEPKFNTVHMRPPLKLVEPASLLQRGPRQGRIRDGVPAALPRSTKHTVCDRVLHRCYGTNRRVTTSPSDWERVVEVPSISLRLSLAKIASRLSPAAIPLVISPSPTRFSQTFNRWRSLGDDTTQPTQHFIAS